MLREAVAMYSRLPGKENVERALAWNNLGKVFQLQGKLRKRIDLYRGAGYAQETPGQ